MRSPDEKLLTCEEMLETRARLKATGRKLVFTNGCFDILHEGHANYLNFARHQGDALCVGLNSDASVKRAKGASRPICTQQERAYVLASIEAVDYVVIFDEDEPATLIAQITPDVLVKGTDWAHYVSGRETVEAAGGKVVLAKMVAGKSTTAILERIKHGAAEPPGATDS